MVNSRDFPNGMLDSSLTLVRMVHILVRMVHKPPSVDRQIGANVLQEMSSAGIDLGTLAQRTGFTKRTLTSRIADGPFTVNELARIAESLGCPFEALTTIEAMSA